VNIVNIRTLLSSAAAALLLASCASQPVNFASLTPLELEDYNRGKPVLKQVYCQEERKIGSHIRKRWCRTVEDWVEHNTRTALALDAMNVPNYSAIRSRD